MMLHNPRVLAATFFLGACGFKIPAHARFLKRVGRIWLHAKEAFLPSILGIAPFSRMASFLHLPRALLTLLNHNPRVRTLLNDVGFALDPTHADQKAFQAISLDTGLIETRTNALQLFRYDAKGLLSLLIAIAEHPTVIADFADIQFQEFVTSGGLPARDSDPWRAWDIPVLVWIAHAHHWAGSLTFNRFSGIDNKIRPALRIAEIAAAKKEVSIQRRLAPLYERLRTATPEEWEAYAKLVCKNRFVVDSPLVRALLKGSRTQPASGNRGANKLLSGTYP